MLQRLKFPLLYLIEILLWLPLLLGFFVANSFVTAKPISSLNLQGKSLPPNWDAAVISHGKYLQGYMISDHPLMFALTIAITIACAIGIFFIHKAVHAQKTDRSPDTLRAHKIANAATFLVVGLVGYFFITRVFVGIDPV